MFLSGFAFNHDIINIYLYCAADQRFEDFRHQSLISGASVFESEWHDFVSIETMCVMKAVFSLSVGDMGIWWYPEKASKNESIPCPVVESTI